MKLMNENLHFQSKNDTAGMASGWNLYSLGGDHWTWNAYGPFGDENGTATTREDGERAASAAEQRLRTR